MMDIGTRVRIVGDRNHSGRTGVVTKVNGPKTREVELDAGFTLWHVKVRNLTEVQGCAGCDGHGPCEVCGHAG